MLYFLYLHLEFDFQPGYHNFISLEMGVLEFINGSILQITNLYTRISAFCILELGLLTHQESGFRAERETLFAARSSEMTFTMRERAEALGVSYRTVFRLLAARIAEDF